MKFNQIIKCVAITIMALLLLAGVTCYILGAWYTGATNNAQALQDAGFTLITLSGAGLFVSHVLNLKDESKKEKEQ